MIHEVVDERAMLVSPDGSELISLNAVGTLVWELLADGAEARDLATHLSPRFEDVTVDVLEKDIRAFLVSLHEQGLVQETDA
ncbi:MAG: PqqD family protein [Dehalococcoidia bacterium]|nr:PqqD family protein [Dehalococcoidia bacterium]